MARVPTYDNFQVTPNTLPTTQLQTPRAIDTTGQQLQQTARTLSAAGQHLGNVAIKAQEQANQVRLDDAMNRVKEEALRLTYDQEAGYTNLRGVNALERPDGQPLADEYAGNLNKYIAQVSNSLGNNVQRAAFSQATQGLMTNFRGQLLKHESDEFRTYAASVSEGVQATALREVALSWDNPEAIDKAVHRIRAHTYQQAQMLGKSAEWQEAQVRKMVSTAHTTALAAALENNHALYADSYLKKYAGQMEADDILRVRGLITKTIDLQVGDNVGAEVFATYAPEIAPNDFARFVGITSQAESGNRDFKDDGTPVVSKTGVKWRMQVTDATAADPGYGITPAKSQTPEEYNRVGEDLLAALLKRNGGDPAKAWAGYNGGQKYVEQATKAAKENGTNWLHELPAFIRAGEDRGEVPKGKARETMAYVQRNMASFGAGLGTAPKPTLMEMLADLRAQPELANNPERLKHAEARVKADFKAMNDAIEQRQGEALDAAYQEVYANGGNFAALPPSVRMAIPGDKLGGVMTFAEKVSKNGGAVHSPEAWAAVLSLPREQLAQLSPIEFFRQFRPVLDDAHLEKGYALLDDAKGVSGEKHLEIITTATRVKNAAITAGILPEKGTPDKKEIQAFTQFSQHIDDRVRQFERVDLQGKRKANSQELQTIIDGVFLDKAFVPRTLWFDGEEPLALMDPENQANAYVKVDGAEVPLSSIPMDQRALIASKLQARGLPVTEQAIATLWVKAGKPRGTTATGNW
ncbi:transglycosylase SLT domain-containing protein [Alcaligenaceae bacterium]|nr:transglycosylase SLT domain-containing protein [Alcaligenaceae bacterium]